RLGESIFRRIDITSGQLILIGKTNGMNDEVELAPFFLNRFENCINSCSIADIAMPGNKGIQFFSQRLNAFLERLTHIGECEFSTGLTSRFGNTPSDGTVIGYAQNQSALAMQ